MHAYNILNELIHVVQPYLFLTIEPTSSSYIKQIIHKKQTLSYIILTLDISIIYQFTGYLQGKKLHSPLYVMHACMFTTITVCLTEINRFRFLLFLDLQMVNNIFFLGCLTMHSGLKNQTENILHRESICLPEMKPCEEVISNFAQFDAVLKTLSISLLCSTLKDQLKTKCRSK